MRLAFLGTPDFAVPILEALVVAGHRVVKVYAQPARPTGRGHKIQPSSVERAAAALDLPVETPVSIKDPGVQRRFAALDIDAAIVAAYGQILPETMLRAPRHGCINVHASLLPRWRGAAPIQRAILAGDAETGVTIMQMERGLDTGPILSAASVPIASDATALSLQSILASVGSRLLVETLAGALNSVVQPADGVTYAAKLERAEGVLDWRDSAIVNERKVRALNPFPGVWFTYGDERIKVLAATVDAGAGTPGTVIDSGLGIACADGIFRPTSLQRPGRGPVPVAAFLNGLTIARGTVLACPATS